MLSVRFWGVRGSIPCPGPDTVVYGGNTACLEIRADERLVIIDLGTGIRALGTWLMENDYAQKGKIDADIFITHTHWDHIMGFPLFSPIYVPGNVLRITGPIPKEKENLESILRTQLLFKYWPVRLEELSARIEFKQIKETKLDLGSGLTVSTKFLNHPIYCLGYRFDYNGKSIAAVYDHEHYSGLDADKNNEITDFIRDADIVIHDAQYSEEEYPNHIGWGHASCKYAVESAIKAKVKKLVLFHHEPAHTDKQLKKLEKLCGKKAPFKVVMAKEGMLLQA
jgi:phosphoribosyl 1,2-cyclic phosphodiesterase